MLNKVRQKFVWFLARAHIDDAMIPVITQRIWSLISAPLGLFFILHYLTEVEQGFLYTMQGLMALQLLFELGVSQGIVQISAHESSALTLKDGVLAGPRDAIGRLGMLFRLFSKWYCYVALGVISVVGPVGWFFLQSKGQTDVLWQPAWISLVLMLAIGMLYQPKMQFLSGLNQVVMTNRIQSRSVIISNAGSWVFYMMGAKLLTPALTSVVKLSILVVSLLRPFRALWVQLHSAHPDIPISVKKDIIPFQGRLTASFLIGVLSNDIFTPACFHYFGTASAGQFGLTLHILTVINTVAFAFMSNKWPEFGRLVAIGDSRTLLQLYRSSYLRLLAAGCGGLPFLVGVIAILQEFPQYTDRFLPLGQTAILALGLFLQYAAIGPMYLVRAHRHEPFVRVYILQGITSVLGIWLLAPRYGSIGVCIAFAICWGVACLWNSIIGLSYIRKHRQIRDSVAAKN